MSPPLFSRSCVKRTTRRERPRRFPFVQRPLPEGVPFCPPTGGDVGLRWQRPWWQFNGGTSFMPFLQVGSRRLVSQSVQKRGPVRVAGSAGRSDDRTATEHALSILQ